MPRRWHGRSKIRDEDGTRPSEEELLNRVIQAKCIMALIGDSPVHFRTRDEDLVITPKIARKLIRLAKPRSRTESENEAAFLLVKTSRHPIMQVMTVVEGKIPKTRTKEFLSMYASVKDQAKPPGWKRSMLLHDTSEEGLYRISTLWESREALEQMRKNARVPFAVEIFRMHGSEPDVRIFEVPFAFET